MPNAVPNAAPTNVTLETLASQDAFLQFIKDRSYSAQLRDLEPEAKEKTFRSMLKVYVNLERGLEKLKDLPPGDERKRTLLELTDTTRAFACSDALLDQAGTRKACDLLLERQYQLTASAPSPLDDLQPAIAIGSTLVGLGAEKLIQAYPPLRITIAVLAAGLTAGVATKISSYVQETWQGSTAADRAQITDSLENALLESRDLLLQDFPGVFRALQSEADSARGELGEMASAILAHPEFREYAGMTPIPETESVLEIMSPLDGAVVQSLLNAGSLAFLDAGTTARIPASMLGAYSPILAEIDAQNEAARQALASQDFALKEERFQKFGEVLKDAQDAAQVGEFIIGNILGDSEAAKTFAKVSDALIKTGGLVQNLLSNAPMGPLGIASSVVGILGSFFGGPSADQLILEGIRDIQKQVDGVREEMERGFTALTRLSLDIIEGINRAIEIDGQILKLNLEQFQLINDKLNILLAQTGARVIEELQNDFGAAENKIETLAAIPADTAGYALLLRELLSDIAALGTVRADDSDITGNNQPQIGAKPSLFDALSKTDELHYLVGYVADAVNRVSGSNYRPANPQFWARGAQDYGRALTLCPTPPELIASLAPDLKAFKAYGIELHTLFQSLTMETLTALRQAAEERFDDFVRAAQPYFRKRTDAISDRIGLPKTGRAQAITSEATTVPNETYFEVMEEPQGVRWRLKPDPILLALKYGFLSIAFDERQLAPALIYDEQSGEFVSGPDLKIINYGLAFKKGPWQATLCSIEEDKLITKKYSPWAVFETGAPKEVSLALTQDYAPLGMPDRIYTFASLQSFCRCIEDALQLERLSLFLKELAENPLQDAPLLLPEEDFTLKNYKAFRDAYAWYALYATALLARQTGAITTARVNTSLAQLDFQWRLYSAAYSDYLASAPDYDAIQDPAQFLPAVSERWKQAVKAELDRIDGLVAQALQEQAPPDEAALNLLFLEEARARLDA